MARMSAWERIKRDFKGTWIPGPMEVRRNWEPGDDDYLEEMRGKVREDMRRIQEEYDRLRQAHAEQEAAKRAQEAADKAKAEEARKAKEMIDILLPVPADDLSGAFE